MQVQGVWADSMLQHMTLEEKIGQLLVLRSKGGNPAVKDSLLGWTKKGHIGGVLLSGLPVENYLEWFQEIQASSQIGLFNGTTELVALNNQFSDVTKFPSPATISTIHSDSVQNRLMDLYVQQCRALGVNFSFAPSLSLTESDDTTYNYNTFEQDAERLLHRSTKMLNKIQDAKILSIGHSFKDLYYFNDDRPSFQDSILQKYRNLAVNGLSGLLIDESIYTIDTTRFYPNDFLRNYLQKNITFDGIVMGEVSAKTTVKDLMYAGLDVFIIDSLPGSYIHQIMQLIKSEDLSMSDLDRRVHKVLMAKNWLEIHVDPVEVDINYAMDLMTNKDYTYYVHRLYESSMVLASNPRELIPFRNTDRHYFKIVSVHETPFNDFKNYFSKYATYLSHDYPIRRDSFSLQPLSERHLKTSTVVVMLDSLDLDAERDANFIKSVNDLNLLSQVVVVNFGNPKNLKYFNPALTFLQLFERNPTTESLAAQLLFGGLESKGRMPIALADHLPYGAHCDTELIRLKYTLPAEVGIDPQQLEEIESVVRKAIRRKAMPGCQIMIVKDGKVFYDESFGYHTYKKWQPVRSSDLYDLASISKIAGTTMAGMKLYENGKFKLEKTIASYLKGTERPKIRKVSVRELFTHRSGLQSYMPIAKYLNNRETIVDGCNKYFCRTRQGNYKVAIGDNMYFNKTYIAEIEKEIHNLRVKRRGRYLYSDVNFNLIKQLVENTANQRMDVYLNRQFFRPLNLLTMGYKPLNRFSKSSIVPTALDNKWRQQVLRGYVHDESAALLGGVGGNAGLFSNANDLAILFQLLLNDGSYGGKQLLNSNTVTTFTTPKYGRRRALGFEVKTKRGTGSCSPLASSKTYGHKGYTGTCIWIDPDTKLTFIFLTNRIHPNPKNKKLTKYKVRQDIHSIVYESLNSYRETLQPEYDVEEAVARVN